MLETLARPAPPAPAAAALGSYGRIALDARVAGASPHQLPSASYVVNTTYRDYTYK